MQWNASRRIFSKIIQVTAAALAVGIASPAHAELDRVGPTSADPRVGGFPAWYQDKTGIAIEFCAPINQAEVDGGYCNVVTGDVIPPEVFPTNFFDEHFYFAAGADLAPANGGRALLVLALESAFNAGVAPGEQIMFSRIRIRLDPVPMTGSYRIIHPYGEDVIDAVEGDRIFSTDDVGIGAQGDFTGAIHSRLGPFLMASNIPGGPELPPITGPVPGKLYIADPARIGPVTGSALPSFIDSTGASRNHNIFRIEGPAGSALGGVNADGSTIDFIETTDFSLIGRLYTETMPGRVNIERASYTRNASGNQLDVFASGFPTTQGRVPAQPRPVAVLPQLSYFQGSCGAPNLAGDFTAPAPGLTEVQMVAEDTDYEGQSRPGTIPGAVCVKDATARNAAGAIVPAYFQASVTDEVAITQASYDPASRTLTVKATSSDTVVPPTLTAEKFGTLAGGQLIVSPRRAVPAKVHVRSSKGGSADLLVTTATAPAAPPPSALLAVNDSFSFDEDAPVQRLLVLANDTGVGGGTVTLTTLPRLGTASVNSDGSVSYTPNLNANGADAFGYTVTAGGATSNSANVAIALRAVNDPTTAVNDGPFTAQGGVSLVLPNVLDNDLDPDGRTDLVDAVDLVASAGATVSGGTGGNVTFLATAPGSYTFTYRALDRAGIRSNPATVIVNVIGEDTVVAASALFRTDKKRWVISGSDSEPNQTVTLTYANGAAAGSIIGTATGDAAGNWLFDQRGFSGQLDPTTFPVATRPTQIQATSSLGGVSRIAITIRN